MTAQPKLPSPTERMTKSGRTELGTHSKQDALGITSKVQPDLDARIEACAADLADKLDYAIRKGHEISYEHFEKVATEILTRHFKAKPDDKGEA
jgi:hypothetical protein